MGARFRFSSDSKALLKLVDAAFAGLPRHRLFADSPRLQITLRLSGPGRVGRLAAPPPLRTRAAGGLITGTVNADNLVVVSPALGTALVVISQDMLRFPYQARYELIEFAVYVLATRALGLLPLHAACVGRNGRGLLLLGDSGAGKSTLALHWLLQGQALMSEDSVFLLPGRWLATAVPNFLHLHANALRLVKDPATTALIRQAPIIRRRSGARKYEIDLRGPHWSLADEPLAITGIVFLSRRQAATTRLLRPLSAPQLLRRLRATQPYASRHGSWDAFLQQAARIGGHVLYRGKSPDDLVEALLGLLQGSPYRIHHRRSRRT
jgi:hypothetical protein